MLVFDKPRGPTSHDLVVRVRRTLGVREVGHAGTLDPMATGVLIVAIGEATKLVPWLAADDKSYEATIALGVETDTLDADGREVRRAPVSESLRAALRGDAVDGPASPLPAALAAERARTSQLPPAFSAIRVDGVRAFTRARRGDTPSLAPRPVRVERLELVARQEAPPSVSVVLDVGKGYYVRALARDLAAALGTVGHLTSLRRTRSGAFDCSEALPVDLPRDALLARLHPLARAAARALPAAQLTESGEGDARQGRPVKASDIASAVDGPCAWLNARGDLVAIGRVGDDGRGRVIRGFCAPPADER